MILVQRSCGPQYALYTLEEETSCQNTSHAVADVPSVMSDRLDQHPFVADSHETAVVDHKAFCVYWKS